MRCQTFRRRAEEKYSRPDRAATNPAPLLGSFLPLKHRYTARVRSAGQRLGGVSETRRAAGPAPRSLRISRGCRSPPPGLLNIHNFGWRRRQYEVAPLLHHPTTPFHGSLATIGPFSGVFDRVSQRRLSQFARDAGLIATKIAKTTSETMHACGALHSTLQ